MLPLRYQLSPTCSFIHITIRCAIATMSDITIKPINPDSKRELDNFIFFAWTIYEGNPYWVPPLLMDIRKTLNPRKNSFFQNAQMQLYIAERNGKTIGRIAAIKNDLHNQTHHDKAGFFGFFECINDQAVANALLDTAKAWLTERGMDTMIGPANPSINHEFGLLIEGFDDSPRIMMPYNPEYYIQLLENYGLSIAKKLLAFKIEQEHVLDNPKFVRIANAVRQRSGITVRSANFKDLKNEVSLIKEIYNAAWRDPQFGGYNWGAIPLTDAEMDELAATIKPLANPEMIIFGSVGDKTIGFALCIPDFNYILKQMNGRLFPFNFLKLFTQRKKIEWARIIILGILPEYQGRGYDAVLYHEVVTRSRQFGIKYGEASWILEDNLPMVRAAQEVMSGTVYKKYAAYSVKW